MKLSEEQARKLGEELAGVVIFPCGDEPTATILESLGRIAFKLCTPYVLEAIREPSEEMLGAGSSTRSLSVYSTWRVMMAKLIEQHKR